jgi:hypothetical protein
VDQSFDARGEIEGTVALQLEPGSNMVSAEKAYAMLGNESLWTVASRCHQVLDHSSIPHSLCGGVAVCLHGYQRNTTDVDLIIHAKDAARVKELLLAESFRWDNEEKEFRSPSGISVPFLMAAERAGKGTEVKIPEPEGDLNTETLEGLSVVRLSRLIEMKLASGMGSLRRTHKDFADVVELIAIRKLDGSFARFLHPSLRPTYRELVRRAADEA